MLSSFIKSATVLTLVLVSLYTSPAGAQPYLGADLSYLNGVLAGDGEFADADGEPIDDVYGYFAARGANAVRLRVWHTPTNITSDCGTPITQNGTADLLLGARRATDAGMSVVLAIHYSDYFVDPGKQARPAVWNGLRGQVLHDSIFNYTLQLLEALEAQNTRPAVVAVGNETDNGFVDATTRTNGFSWEEDAPKFNAGLAAIDTFNSRFGASLIKSVHITVENAEFVAKSMIDNGVTNFDLFGVSFYPHFAPDVTITEAVRRLAALKVDYSKDVMWFETGFPWTSTGFSDDYRNFLGGKGNVVTQPISRQGQLDFLNELTRRTLAIGGLGVLYWEPAWVTSDLCDQWDQGSSYENVTFFDFENGNRALPAFDFFRDGLVGLRQNPQYAPLRVYPNPRGADSIVNVEASAPIVAWRVYDAAGRELMRERLSGGRERLELQPGEGAVRIVVEYEDGSSATAAL